MAGHILAGRKETRTLRIISFKPFIDSVWFLDWISNMHISTAKKSRFTAKCRSYWNTVMWILNEIFFTRGKHSLILCVSYSPSLKHSIKTTLHMWETPLTGDSGITKPLGNAPGAAPGASPSHPSLEIWAPFNLQLKHKDAQLSFLTLISGAG